MKITKIVLLVFIVTALYSCDCARRVQGIVIDSKTQLPIGNVEIRIENIPDTAVVEDFFICTDSFGNFEIISPSAMLFVCPKMVLSFEKDGYIKTRKRYKNWNPDTVIIILEKQEK